MVGHRNDGSWEWSHQSQTILVSAHTTSTKAPTVYPWHYNRYFTFHLAGPARPVRPVRFWPYHFSVAIIISRRRLPAICIQFEGSGTHVVALNWRSKYEMASCSRFVVPELLPTPHQPSTGFVFPRRAFGIKNVVWRSFQRIWLNQWYSEVLLCAQSAHYHDISFPRRRMRWKAEISDSAVQSTRVLRELIQTSENEGENFFSRASRGKIGATSLYALPSALAGPL